VHGTASRDIYRKDEGQNCTFGWQSLGTAFWNAEGRMLVDFLPEGETIHVACQDKTLKKLGCALHEEHMMKKTVIFQ
jgi:hypothetical protein